MGSLWLLTSSIAVESGGEIWPRCRGSEALNGNGHLPRVCADPSQRESLPLLRCRERGHIINLLSSHVLLQARPLLSCGLLAGGWTLRIGTATQSRILNATESTAVPMASVTPPWRLRASQVSSGVSHRSSYLQSSPARRSTWLSSCPGVPPKLYCKEGVTC